MNSERAIGPVEVPENVMNEEYVPLVADGPSSVKVPLAALELLWK